MIKNNAKNAQHTSLYVVIIPHIINNMCYNETMMVLFGEE